MSGPLLFFQNGDFGEACRRFDAGGSETYYDQKRSVDFVRDLSSRHPVVVVSRSAGEYETRISPSLTAVGLSGARFHSRDIGDLLLREFQPGSMIVRTPHAGVLSAAVSADLPCFACFADVMLPVPVTQLFTRAGLRRLRFNRRLRALLRSPSITCIGNHGRAASVSLRDVIGVAPGRIVPWEWTRVVPDLAGRDGRDGETFSLFFAGKLSRSKGVGDLLRAVEMLRADGLPVDLTIAGAGEEKEDLERQARDAGLGGHANFVGQLPNADVRQAMRAADAVVVPSRHEYAEGLPNVIFEALGAGAPLVVSDHPSFVGRFRRDRDCMVFRAGDPADLAARIRELAENPGLRASLCAGAPRLLAGLYFGASWYDLVENFVQDPRNRDGWVRPLSLAALENGGSVATESASAMEGKR